tara:strand:- start:15595 stop:16068 length:474 start_codon:yes stop_codon:yes gene_type:complete
MFIKTILAYTYILLSFISLLILYILKCKYNIDFFDKFLFINYDKIDPNNIEIYTYYITHFIIFFVYGILFGIKNYPIMIFKIIIYEFLLYLVKFCDLRNIDIKSKKFKYIIYGYISSVIISIFSYYLGTLISNYIYNKVFNFNNKLNINIKFNKIKK